MTVNETKDEEKSYTAQTVRIPSAMRKPVRFLLADTDESFQTLVLRLLETELEKKKRSPEANRATFPGNESTSETPPSKELEDNRPISTLVSELSDKLRFVCNQKDYGPDTLGWYMRKLAEILSTVSVDDALALRFLSEAADIKVKVDGGSISITGSVGKNKAKRKGTGRRAEDATIREGMDRLRDIGAQYPGSESDSAPAGRNPRRKTR